MHRFKSNKFIPINYMSNYVDGKDSLAALSSNEIRFKYHEQYTIN